MVVRKVSDKRSPFKYMVIIKNGLDWRLFSDLPIMCEIMGLDDDIVRKYINKRGFYTGFEFTVFRVQEENKNRNRGYYTG